MTLAVRTLGLDGPRWARVGPASFWSGVIRAVAASGFMALNRFGGLFIDTPRAFTRMTLIGVYGWLWLAVGIWGVAHIGRAVSKELHPWSAKSVQQMIVAVGLAHTPMVVLALAIFVFGGLFEVLGPGLVVAVLVLGFWFPAMLTMATRYAYDLSILRAGAVVAVPYLIWLAVVGRHLLGQVQHLL